ncbi:RING finger protein [Trichinella patagoniensis]|uniref:RING finger protein n=1 Tax=Trichinella patagoniensis TaxID=990121 RepID=A0A0V0ZYC2_9BILA|nr:RING finger protein [Trichinella patagoniensis]
MAAVVLLPAVLFSLFVAKCSAKADYMPDEDALICNVTNGGVVGRGGTRTIRLEGLLFPTDLSRPMIGSIRFEYISPNVLWSGEVKRFCDLMRLTNFDHLGTSPDAAPSADNLGSSIPPSASQTLQAPLAMFFTALPLDSSSNVGLTAVDSVDCFSEEVWNRNLHSMGQLSMVVAFAERNQRPFNLTKLISTFKGVHFPFLFLSSTLSTQMTGAKDPLLFFRDAVDLTRNSISCVISVKGDFGDSKASDSLLNNFSRTSVLFVSVSFIILMVISLAWLIFYYIQRFRYAHAKDRLARRLFNAARKTLTKLPVKTLRNGDNELNSLCPVCIEPFHDGDVIRILVCNHLFHKTCVDPWLLQHRTCPLCKLDILKAVGYSFKQSEESVRDDGVSAIARSAEAASNMFRSLPATSDFQDPFFPTPAHSPPLVQHVLHAGNTHCYTIIPMTVHSAADAVNFQRKECRKKSDTSCGVLSPADTADGDVAFAHDNAGSCKKSPAAATGAAAAASSAMGTVAPVTTTFFKMRVKPASQSCCRRATSMEAAVDCCWALDSSQQSQCNPASPVHIHRVQSEQL